MYQTISITTVAVTFVGIALHCIAFPFGKERKFRPVKNLVDFLTLVFIEQKLSFEEVLRKLVYLFMLLFIKQKLSLVGVLRKLVYLLALLCFVVLAVTGFYPTLILGGHISGYLVMVHATFAPVFAICLAVLAVMWARNCRFNRSDWPWFQRIVQRVTLVKSTGEERKSKSSGLSTGHLAVGQKVTFWLIIFLALPLILSIVLSMLSFFGMHGAELSLSVHRYTALVFVLVGIVHIYLVIRTKMQ
jgi:cytochrome b subunit of formate dehydrogenase